MTNCCIIFGGSGDIGHAICKKFAEHQFEVFSSYHSNYPQKDNPKIHSFFYSALHGLSKSFLSKLDDYHIRVIVFAIGISSNKKAIRDTSIK